MTHKNKKIIKILKIARNILFGLIIIVIGFLIVLFIINKISLAIESKSISPIGNRVEVYKNKYMNLYKVGSGKQTVVMLSGYGTSSPVIDFKKLADKLSQNYKVVIVEYFGYGFSDNIDIARTNKNIVDETRTALLKSGINGPYILMPHSLSGIYALYYANKYPDEVSGIVGLDSSAASIAKYMNHDDTKIPTVYSIVSELGITRFAITALPSLVGYKEVVSGVDSKYLDTIKYLTSKNYLNNTTINESNQIYANGSEAKDYKYPYKLPVLTILSKQTVDETLSKSDWWQSPRNWIEIHEDMQTNNNIQSIKVINGTHYIHRGNTDSIKTLVDEFVVKNKIQ